MPVLLTIRYRKRFNARSLFHWLYERLRELRTAFEKQQLRFYIIPDRNLMAACGLEDGLQSKWVADITDMMEEGPRVILRLEKIRKSIVASPEPMLCFSKKRVEMEMVGLELLNKLAKCKNESRVTDTDFIMKALQRRLGGVLR
ncbi:hypothetical protein DPMN_174995 [Dreissena polymorpha]|uniref:Uncharacterized protein n=1 Tax=Dreissena polymorpha TaxID=45954 RepID=A0A9D4IFM5_DREPO|nr:hypothetical protein DPMN_174995 [Dreissena polymorpha]